MELLCEYVIHIKHIKGQENKVANSLSRKKHVMRVVYISTSMLDLKDYIIKSNVTNDYY